ncbi:MAG: hypothetical protein ACHQ4H_09545 [Ktedonobacterales bacterium]
MSRKPSPQTRGARAGSRTHRQHRALVGVLRHLRVGALAIGAAVAVGAFALALATAAPSQGPAASAGRAAEAPNWVRLASTPPAEILRAARATRAYQDVYNAPQTLPGQALRTGTLGTPVLVHVYRPTPGLLNVYVIPVFAPALAPTGSHIAMLLDFSYDRAHARLRAQSFAGPFVPSDPEYGQAFPRMTAEHALATFAAPASVPASRVSTAGALTELVYFPVDLDRLNNPSHPVAWTAGGQFPDLAVWRIALPGRPDTIVGLDGRTYASNNLPLAPGAAAPATLN